MTLVLLRKSVELFDEASGEDGAFSVATSLTIVMQTASGLFYRRFIEMRVRDMPCDDSLMDNGMTFLAHRHKVGVCYVCEVAVVYVMNLLYRMATKHAAMSVSTFDASTCCKPVF